MSDVGPGVRFQTPVLPDQARIDAYFLKSREVGWYSNFGPCVRAFERRVSNELFSGMPVASANNATIALMVAIRAVFGEAREDHRFVVVPSFTFVGSVSAITWAGFRPLFVDIENDDWQVSEESLTEALAVHGAEIAGVLLTTTFGTPLAERRRAGLERALAERRIPLVVDAAAGLGSCLPSRLPGSMTVYSLHATKPFAVGEAALAASPDLLLTQRFQELTNFGFDDEHVVGSVVGLNGKLPEILAATGLAVLDEFPMNLEHRRKSALELAARLARLGMTGQVGSESSSFQFLPLLCPTADARRRLLDAALGARVQIRTYFDPPMHLVPAFSGDPVAGRLAGTDDVSGRIVALPMSNDLSPADADAIVAVCQSVLG